MTEFRYRLSYDRPYIYAPMLWEILHKLENSSLGHPYIQNVCSLTYEHVYSTFLYQHSTGQRFSISIVCYSYLSIVLQLFNICTSIVLGHISLKNMSGLHSLSQILKSTSALALCGAFMIYKLFVFINSPPARCLSGVV